MVGLSVVLDAQRSLNRAPQVISNIPKIKCLPPSSSSSSSSPLPGVRSLDACFLCNQKLLPGKDIYMYKGDRAFCSVECRCRQIVMDEEEDAAGSSGALKPSSSSSASASRHRKGTQKTDRMGSTTSRSLQVRPHRLLRL